MGISLTFSSLVHLYFLYVGTGRPSIQSINFHKTQKLSYKSLLEGETKRSGESKDLGG
jgi:hypothetical protein